MTSAMIARKAKLKTHLVSAKAKVKQHVTPRRVLLLAAAACSASLLLLTLRTLHSAAARGAGARAAVASPAAAAQQQQRECADDVVPAAVAAALVHFATSSATPPQTEAEAGAAARVLARRAPCNLLVFGLDAGSALWAALNHGGRTLFLDAGADAIASVRATRPAGLDLDPHHVAYQEHATSPITDELLALRDSPDCTGAAVSSPAKTLSPEHLEHSPCKLAPRGLPAAFYDTDWDVIVVNAPVASAVYAAGVAARARRPEAGETDVVVHGVDSPAEERFARAFLCEGYIKEEAGRTRHFAVPSHRDKEATPFCP